MSCVVTKERKHVEWLRFNLTESNTITYDFLLITSPLIGLYRSFSIALVIVDSRSNGGVRSSKERMVATTGRSRRYGGSCFLARVRVWYKLFKHNMREKGTPGLIPYQNQT